MAVATTPDYRNSHFEKSHLPVHTGEPTFDVIRTWHNILKANSTKVHTNLFGGNHGYLALLLSDAAYALISPAAIARPAHPGILVIPPGTLLHVANTMKDTHKEHLRLFREYQAVEAAFQQMLIEAIDDVYLEAIRDATTNSINMTTYDIIQYLYDTYGDITPEGLEDERDTVKNLTYDPNLPIDTIFTKIEKFTNFAEAARSPLNQQQSIDFAYNIFRRARVFQRYLLDWDKRAHLSKTWIQMKIDFRQAVKDLRKTGDLQVRDLNANLVQEIVSGLQEAIEPALLAASSTTPSLAPTESMDVSTISLALQMNSATSDPIILLMQQQLATLTTLVQQMQTGQQGQQGYTGGRGRGRGSQYGGRGSFQGRGRGRGRGQQQNTWQTPNAHSNPHNPFQPQQTPNNTLRWPRAYNKYCWTHGACGHTSSICRVPHANHCWEATFQNKMNGNTTNCS